MNYLLSFLEKLRNLPKPVKKYLPVVFIGLMALFLLLIFPQKLFTIFLSLVIIVLASFSTVYKRITQISVGIELFSFATIVFLYAFGFFHAIIAAFIIMLVASVIEGQLDSLPKQFSAMVLVCLVMLPFLDLPILVGGMIFVIVRNVILFIMYYFLYGSGLLSAFGPVALNLILNYLLLDKYGEVLIQLLV